MQSKPDVSIKSDPVRKDEAELMRLIPPDRRDHCVLIGFFTEAQVRQFLEGKSLQRSSWTRS